MRGHIAKKGNRYYAVLYEGIDPTTGKPRHRWHAAGDTGPTRPTWDGGFGFSWRVESGMVAARR